MESKQPVTQREIPSQHWRSCKLIIDPVLTNGFYKVYRYDGLHFNMPVQDLGVFPVDRVRDPRICRLWSKYEETNLVVPKYKIDECYVGPIPPKEVTFARLNDNIKEGFLIDMCKKYGDILEVEIFYNPKNKKHLGIARVIFDTVKAAKKSVQHLHETSVMGNVIHVEIDPKGENRMRYLHLLLSGLYTPWTLPVGSDEETLQSLIDNLPSSRPIHRQENISSPFSVATPLSLDTAYSSIWQDTPCSFGLTPRSQGTPCTPCLSGTPLSQDSCYSSLHATPVLQGEPSSYSVHRSLRREVCYRKPTRPYGREHRSSDFWIEKHLKPQPTLPLPTQTQTSHNHKPALWCQNAQSNSTEPSFHLPSLEQESREVLTTTSEASPLSCSSAAAACAMNRSVSAERQAVASSPDSHGRITESPPPPLDTSPGSPCPVSESHSLDSRIEMLLRKTHCLDAPLFDRKGLMASVHHQGRPASPHSSKSPASDDLLDCTPPLGGSATVRRHPSHSELVDVSTTPLPEEDEAAQAVSTTPLPEEDKAALAIASLLRNSQTLSSFLIIQGRNASMKMAHANSAPPDKDDTRLNSLSIPKQLVSNVDMESSNNSLCGALIPGQEIPLPQIPLPPFASLNSGAQGRPFKPRPLVLPANSNLPIPPFLFPVPLSSNPPPSIPPSLPPFPVRLSNGTIPIPPPGWIAPPVHLTGIPMPPPPIPPPPAVLGPLPPSIAMPSALHPAYLYHLPIWSSEPLDKANPPKHGSAPYNGLVWPRLPLPRFNPFVPPPGYMSVKEDPYKVTVERVLGFLIEELKSIIKKDITRRMVEGVAFKAFDEWWDSQEQKAKVAVTPVKVGEARVKENTKLTDPLSQITGQRIITHLPSFKVRKGAHGTKELEGQENVSSLARENNSHCENSELGQGSNIARYTSEESTTDGDSCPAQKRRHARPFELDSDGDEGQEVENTLNLDGEIVIDGQGKTVAVEYVPKQCDRDNGDDDEEEDEAQKQKNIEDGDVIVSRTTEGMHVSDNDNLLVMESSSSEESEYSSDSSYSSEGTEDSSYCELSSGEDEGTEEDEEDEHRSDKYIVISSDEESASPAAPLTPGAQLELALQEWSEEGLGWDPGQDLYPACQDSPSVLDPVMEFQPSENKDHLHSLPSIGLPVPVVEPIFDVEMESPEWRAESPEDMENLRPLTPTGSLVDSDPDLLIRNGPTPPAVEEVERPHTPGRGVAVILESEDSVDRLLSLLPTDGEPAHQQGPPGPHASYPAYQDMPKTPGREERSIWTLHNSLRVPATPGRSTTPSEGSVVLSPPICSPFPLPSLCNSIYIKTPQTPGRDIILPLRTLVHNRRMPVVTTSWGRSTVLPLCCDEFLRSSSTAASSPCSLSESSTEAPAQSRVWISPDARMRPLQGLENMPGLLDEGSQREKDKSTMRREQWRWQRRRRRRIRRWQRQRSLLTATLAPSSPCAISCRSHREEMRILHSFWKEGLDEEDARLLEVMYKRLLQEDNGFSWLSDTLWTPHPVARVLTEKNEEQNNWQRNHKTGSSRSEGFYRISKNDKIKYLNNTRLATDLPFTNTQGKCIPPQTQASSRAGSDFRSEQRRLLSSFSCDSDLVKFNQLKYRKKRICFCRSHIHDWGLFAMEPIAAEEMVIEYVGQTIRQIIADTREKRYEDEGIGSSYLFRVDQDTIIDATKCGNLARFINHSCNPNCYAKIITVESQKKIVIYSRQPISVNEEITYDYKFPIEEEKIPCLCGSDGCRGSLN